MLLKEEEREEEKEEKEVVWERKKQRETNLSFSKVLRVCARVCLSSRSRAYTNKRNFDLENLDFPEWYESRKMRQVNCQAFLPPLLTSFPFLFNVYNFVHGEHEDSADLKIRENFAIQYGYSRLLGHMQMWNPVCLLWWNILIGVLL